MPEQDFVRQGLTGAGGCAVAWEAHLIEAGGEAGEGNGVAGMQPAAGCQEWLVLCAFTYSMNSTAKSECMQVLYVESICTT